MAPNALSTRADANGVDNFDSIITLVVFLLTNICVIFPFQLSLPLPRAVPHFLLTTGISLRLLPPSWTEKSVKEEEEERKGKKLILPFNFITAPIIAVLFLLAVQAIGRKELHDGIIGANNIKPYDIMAFFFSLAYLAISLDATGFIRFLVVWVVKKGGKVGHQLFFALYSFFFVLGTFIGNDPIILSGTAFLAYLTRVSSNIKHPRAWIYSQFAVANISSAILVSSNPTNLVISGAFQIAFIEYTANMVVPVVCTAIILFPFLLYIIFPSTDLIPLSIDIVEMTAEEREASNVARPGFSASAQAKDGEEEVLPLSEVFNPFLDKSGALFGGVLIAITLAVLLATNAAHVTVGVYAVTVPAGTLMLARDLVHDWMHREETRELGRKNRGEGDPSNDVEQARAATEQDAVLIDGNGATSHPHPPPQVPDTETEADLGVPTNLNVEPLSDSIASMKSDEKYASVHIYPPSLPGQRTDEARTHSYGANGEVKAKGEPSNLYSILNSMATSFVDTFATVCAVISHLPFALLPFSFSMFILVQSLANLGWVEIWAKWWEGWANRTGTLGIIGGMGFVSVILCNFAGTNIGASILLSRILQSWLASNQVSDRNRDAAIYALTLGVNYGAFSAVFSASLAGLLWRDILRRKYIHVRRLDFARINLPIIAICMTVGLSILTAEVYIIKDGKLPDNVSKL
ncbi:hypothetical protein BT69DRAFT_1263406 [Atractiella rhizophila]|nr:hypothetical protein BT69DRAFT_1263406 [Atractiella rhizophila]